MTLLKFDYLSRSCKYIIITSKSRLQKVSLMNTNNKKDSKVRPTSKATIVD